MSIWEGIIKHSVGRFQLVNQNQLLLPGSCVVNNCLTGPFVDFGLYIEAYGNIYFCLRCFREAANVIGMVDMATVMSLEAMIKASTTAIEDLQTENKDLRNALDTLRRLDSVSPVDFVGITLPELPDYLIKKAESFESSDSGSAGRKERSPKQADVQGPTDI